MGRSPGAIGETSPRGCTEYVVDAHASLTSAVRPARSGSPVAAPAASTQDVMGPTSGLNRALLPTMAKLFWHAVMRPFFDSVGSSFESHVSTTRRRHPTPPRSLTYLSNPLTASMLPWNSPGASGE